MIDHGQEKRVLADQWSGGDRGTTIAFFPVLGHNKRDMATTSSCNALAFVLDKPCVTPENDHKSLHTSHEQLCYRSLGDRKTSQADERFGHGRTNAPKAAPLAGGEDHGHPQQHGEARRFGALVPQHPRSGHGDTGTAGAGDQGKHLRKSDQHGRAAVEGALIPKGPTGARKLLKSLKAGKHLAMLVDQKMNDGIPVPFFGRDVMTAPALAELALRYDCPVVPARVVRLKGARFLLKVFPPLELIKTGNHQADVVANMAQVNALIEQWVRETPEQWLWLHNRWPD